MRIWLGKVLGGACGAVLAIAIAIAPARAAMEETAPAQPLARVAIYDQASELLARGDARGAAKLLEAMAAEGDALDHSLAAAAAFAVPGIGDLDVRLTRAGFALLSSPDIPDTQAHEWAAMRQARRNAAAGLFLQRVMRLREIERGAPSAPLRPASSGDRLVDVQSALMARDLSALGAFAKAARGDQPDLASYEAILTYAHGLDAAPLLWVARALEEGGRSASREAWRAFADAPCLSSGVPRTSDVGARPSFEALQAREVAGLASGVVGGDESEPRADVEVLAAWELTARLARAIAPKDSGITFGLVDALHARDKTAEADALLARIPRTDYNYVCALFRRALFARDPSGGALADKAEQRQAALARAAPGLEHLLPVAAAEGEEPRLGAIMQALEAKPPPRIEVALRAARVATLEAQGRSVETVGDLEALAGLEPENWNWLNSLGYVLVQRDGPTPAAIAALRRSVALHRNAFNVDSLGWALFKAGDIVEGAALVAEALALDVGQGEIHANLGDIRAAQGRLQEAVELWETAAAFDVPDHVRERLRRNLAAAQGAI